MDTQAIKKIFSLYDTVVDYETTTTFKEELDRQCSLVIVPACIIAMCTWIFYIRVDVGLFQKISLVVIFLRIGLTVIGTIILVLHFTSFFRKRNYWLLVFLACYFELAAAIIVGLIAPHPGYMGGLAMLVLLLPLMPFRKIHSIVLLILTLFLFILTGLKSGMKFENSKDLYGLFNLIAATATSLIAIIVLDSIRRVTFNKNRMIYANNEKLKTSSVEIFRINEKLKKANDLKSKLLEIAAHDLKNPLQVIVGYTDLLQEKLKGNRVVTQKLSRVFQTSDNMIGLLNRLLKVLSIDSGKLVLQKRNVNVVQLLESLINENRQIAKKKDQEIYFSAVPECVIHADETLLKEIFDNLINNAVKFSFPGKSLRVKLEVKNGCAICSFSDEGPGFSKFEQEKIFTRFQALSAKPTGGEPSTGLGLAIVKELVELHEGEVRVESEPGVGSTFIVRIPCR